MKRRRRHSLPVLNATSTADISFMLLIFFLVATSIDADQGLRRQLPAADEEQQQVQVDVSKDQLLALVLTADGQFMANDETITAEQLRAKAADFIFSEGSSHLITLTPHPDAPYDAYFKMQNQLSLAYADARDQLARKLYNHPLTQCTFEEQEDINSQLPWRIAESYASEEGGES